MLEGEGEDGLGRMTRGDNEEEIPVGTMEGRGEGRRLY